MAGERILIVDDDAHFKDRLSSVLRKEGFQPESAENAKAAIDKLEASGYPFVVCDVRLKGIDGLEFIRRVKERKPETSVVVLSMADAKTIAIEAIRSGASDFLEKGAPPEEIVWALKKAIERDRVRKDIPPAKKTEKSEYEFSSIIAKSALMKDIFNTIQKIAEYKTTCLLLGESGTGKELIARAIHYNSSRADQPFITVNCGAIPENLLESELFGHVKGAFTGAIRTKKGLFEEAHNGTLFLDEIGELPLLLQVKLLRALQEEEIRRVGDVNPIKIDVRIVAATVKDLTREVEQGTFREDLYYRLHVLPIQLPPLRDRKEDIPILCEFFIGKYKKKLSSNVLGFDPRVLKVFMDYDWPGNVRELENTIERAMVLAMGDRIQLENLPAGVRDLQRGTTGGIRIPADELSIKKMSRMIEEELIMKALHRSQGNRTKAAKLLEISHRALLYKIKRYKLENQIKNLKNE